MHTELGNQITKTVQQWHSRTELFLYPTGAYQDEYGPHKCKECPAGTLQWDEGKGLCFLRRGRTCVSTVPPKYD